jgi:hypothetical protein
VRPYVQKLFALVIALATAGAQVVCACTTPAVFHQPAPRQITQSCAGQKECCRKAESKPVQPARQEPCNQCNLKHRAEQAMPDRHDGALTPHVMAFAIPAAEPMLAILSAPQPRLIADAAPPPPLKDLFHAHSLLLN